MLRPITGATAALTVGAAAVALASPPARAVAAKITVHAQPIRYTRDTTTPTAALGHYATNTNRLLLIGQEEIRGFKAIREGATDATLTVSYYEGTYGPDDIALLAAGH